MEKQQNVCSSEFSYQSTLDYIQSIDERTAEYMLISRILISNSYWTTYRL